MSEFTVQSETIDVERIMDQIRARVREKRGNDYPEAQIRELAGLKLERLLDPDKVRSDLVEHYRRQHKGGRTKLAFPEALQKPPAGPESFEFDPDIIYRSSRGLPGQLLYGIRKLLSPIVKFFINVDPIVHALHVQREINERQNEAINWMVQTQADFIDRVTKLFEMSSSRLAAREEIDALNYEVMNNLVVEMTRLSIEMKNHRMRVESVAGRLDFNERRARAVEGVVPHRDETRQPGKETRSDPSDESAPKRRRRRRGRRRPARTEGAGPENALAGPTTESASTNQTPRSDPNNQAAETASEPSSPAGNTPPAAPPEAPRAAPESTGTENRQAPTPTPDAGNSDLERQPPSPAANGTEPQEQ